MTLYCGIDLHSNNSVVVILDDLDKVIFKKRLRNSLELILEHLEPYQSEISGIAVESTYNWYWLVDGLMDVGFDVHLVNTTKAKQYSGLKHTDDADDARWLAHMMRLGILPTGYIYPKELRWVRDLLRKRSFLVKTRVQMLLSTQGVYSRVLGARPNKRDVYRITEEQALNDFGHEHLVLSVTSQVSVLNAINEQIALIEQKVRKAIKLEPSYKYLRTIYGIGDILALTIMLETGDIGRFDKVGNYASYSRCVDSKRLSNGKKKGENNQKNGNKYLAWSYIEAANFAIRNYDAAKKFYQKKLSKTNRIVALKSLAHKLARAGYYVMKDQVPFKEELLFK